VEPLSRDQVSAALEIVNDDLQRVEQVLIDGATGATSFLTESTTYLMRAGGKRLRPALMVLAAHLGPDDTDGGASLDVCKTAAAIEMTHLATLYHDDVIDEADLRRGVPSVNEKWGNTVAILAGDYLFARSSSIAAEVGGEVPTVLADAIAEVVQGQVRELESAYDVRRSVEQYFSTIREKTAALMEASTRLGASLSGCSPERVKALREFGAVFGFAFQLADDLLDLAASEEELGKPPGTDLRDGVYTLPVIYALEHDPDLADCLGKPDPDVETVRAGVQKSGAFEHTLVLAEEHCRRALALLEGSPDCPARDSLERLTRLIVDRVPAFE
jgi:geranylgeranyl pyrophosphate synthase